MNSVQFEFSVPNDHPSLTGHFPGNPVVPGVLLLDHVLSNLQRSTGRSVALLRQVKFITVLHPGERAHAHCEVEGEGASFRVTVQRSGDEVAVASGSLTLAQNIP
jgi:3-hydroxymyristoyl/3-hydroxydecanoyl-(acyl carrier protein) dehydratase